MRKDPDMLYHTFQFADLVNGGILAVVSSTRSHVGDVEGHCVQLLLLFVVRGSSGQCAETQGAAELNAIVEYSAAGCSGCYCRRVLSVSSYFLDLAENWNLYSDYFLFI